MKTLITLASLFLITFNSFAQMKHTLPELPYAKDALEPKMSQKTIEYHYGKHLQTYINNLNGLIEGTEFAEKSIPTIIAEAPSGAIFNNAAQTYNHTLFFETLSPNAQKVPQGALLMAIERDLGSFESFKDLFSKSALSLFGSGWVYLAMDCDGKLEIMAMPNADNPIKQGRYPLMTIDVWEHSYYLDYQNRRVDYIQNFWDLLDWKAVEKRFESR